MNLDTYGNIADIVAIPIAVLGVYYVVHQLTLSRRENIKEHIRRKKELTMNHYVAKRNIFTQKNALIVNALKLEKFDNITKEQVIEIQKNSELLSSIKYIMSFLSNLAVGVKNDIYDLDLLIDLSGTAFNRIFERYYLYIIDVRENFSDTIYQDIDWMINEIKEKQLAKTT